MNRAHLSTYSGFPFVMYPRFLCKGLHNFQTYFEVPDADTIIIVLFS